MLFFELIDKKMNHSVKEQPVTESKLIQSYFIIFFFQVNTIEKNPTENILIKKQSKDETVEIFSDMKSSVLQTLNDIVQNYLPIPGDKKPFDSDEFYQRLKKDMKYPINASWIEDFAVMSCPAQSFVERFSIQGEFFES